LKLIRKTDTVTNEDDVWICYKSNVTVEEDFMTSDEMTTISLGAFGLICKITTIAIL